MSYKQFAIDVANKFKFEPLLGSAIGVADEIQDKNLSRCENHLDAKFMAHLDNLDFLDSKYLSK